MLNGTYCAQRSVALRTKIANRLMMMNGTKQRSSRIIVADGDHLMSRQNRISIVTLQTRITQQH